MNDVAGSLIGVDLGTNTGIATVVLNLRPRTLKLRLLELASASELRAAKKRHKDALRFHDPRVLSLWLHLQSEVDHLPEPVWVAFEDVRFAKSLAQAQLWSSLRGALWTLPVHPSRYLSVTTSTLKKFAEASGGGKDAMQKALKTKLAIADTREYDDNIVDAAWVTAWALETHFGIGLQGIV